MATTEVVFGSLTMESGTLTLGGNSPIRFKDGTTILQSASRVGFNAEVETDFGGINASGAPVTIVKGGPSTWVLDTPPQNIQNAAW